VPQRDRLDGKAEQTERTMNIPGVEPGTEPLLNPAVKYVAEIAPDHRHGGGGAENWNGLSANHVEGPQIIDAMHMVGVSMGIKHRVHPGNSLAQSLVIQVGAGIDQDIAIVPGNQGTAACAPVAGIARTADITAAPEHGDPGAGACAEQHNVHGLRVCHDGLRNGPGPELHTGLTERSFRCGVNTL